MADTLSSHYPSLIAEVDKTLSMVREFLLASRDDGERHKNMNRINDLLDQRLGLMKARDAAMEAQL